MINFNFIAGDSFTLTDFEDIEKFVDTYPDFQTVVLKDESQLELLLELMGIKKFHSEKIDKMEFTKYWDLSASKLPELSENEFDDFYKSWINKSQRDNNMDEYGNLIFLQGISRKWNKLNYRLIVKEK